MSRERDAIELIWECLANCRSARLFTAEMTVDHIEQILTQMEDLIQEDLEQMESITRSRETPKTCPLLEEFNKSQAATNTGPFWAHPDSPATIVVNLEDYPAEGDTYSHV